MVNGPSKRTVSFQMEKMDSSNSACARGSNPSSKPEAEDVTLVLKGSFAAAKTLNVWYSDMTGPDGEGPDQPVCGSSGQSHS